MYIFKISEFFIFGIEEIHPKVDSGISESQQYVIDGN